MWIEINVIFEFYADKLNIYLMFTRIDRQRGSRSQCLDLTDGNLRDPRLSPNILDAAEILTSAEFALTRSGDLERGLRNGAKIGEEIANANVRWTSITRDRTKFLHKRDISPSHNVATSN